MNNEHYLLQLQNVYESLKYFTINNNVLSLNFDKQYHFELKHVSLINLNPTLFLLNPNDIYKVIYLIELLFKQELTQEEQQFVVNYTDVYLQINDRALSNQEDDLTTYNGLKIPIYLSYDPAFMSNAASIIIQNKINDYTEEINNGRGNQIRLVRTNPNVQNTYNDEYTLKEFGKAGFTTLLLIGATALGTIAYIINFILQN